MKACNYFMQQKNTIYWLAQVGGWVFYYLANAFFNLTLRTHEQPGFFTALFLETFLGFWITQWMRKKIIKRGIIYQSIQAQLKFLLLATFLFSLLFAFAVTLTNIISGISLAEDAFFPTLAVNWVADFMILLIWNLLYLGYHYVLKSNQEALNKVRLENMVQEMELQTIRAHVNPHFIFNALNSIKALVVENPDRARTAITELSNILRSSLSMEKARTTSMEKELQIVRDYLALEKIRFEERLHISYDIDGETLPLPVPPMMVQTIVENAIKHGISKSIKGGYIQICSQWHESTHQHEIKITNTGHYQERQKHTGFGLASTRDRLKLLFGKNASFSIMDHPDKNEVIVTIFIVHDTFDGMQKNIKFDFQNV